MKMKNEAMHMLHILGDSVWLQYHAKTTGYF